jgi:hypothetical protein
MKKKQKLGTDWGKERWKKTDIIGKGVGFRMRILIT